MDRKLTRGLWKALEPFHALIYFAPESLTAYAEIGLKGYWMGYFASRSAPMGAVPAEVVMATFYNFHPDKVRRAIPDAWKFATPQQVLDARVGIAEAALGRAVTADAGLVKEAADLAERAARDASPEGRPLFAGHASLAWPSDPLLRLWHSATLLREHRGDGHIAALLSEGVTGFEAHGLAAGAGLIDPDTQKKARGISDDEWNEIIGQLTKEGLLDSDARLTETGRTLKQRIEDRTDDLAAQAYGNLSEHECERLVELCTQAAPGKGLPHPNPIGLSKS